MRDLGERLHPWRRWIPAGALLLLTNTTSPFLSPDSVEMVAAGRCALSVGADCSGLELWFWPPALGLIGGMVSKLGLDPGLAATWVSLLFACLALIPLSRLAHRMGGEIAAWTAPLLLLAVPAMRTHLMMGDARPLALFGILWAWELALTRNRGLLVGLAAGLAVLSRTESLLPVALLLLYLLWDQRRSFALACLCLCLILLPYWSALSFAAGHLTISSQGWQAQVYPWLGALPMPWLELDLAAGARGTPLRALLVSSDVAAGSALSWSGPALRMGLAAAILPASLPFALLGLRRRRTTAVVLAIALPSLLVTALLPQAQDVVLPAKNLLWVGWMVALLAGSGMARLAAMGLPRLPIVLSGVLLLGTLTQPQDVVSPNSAAFAPDLLDTLPPCEGRPCTAAAALSTAPVVLRAGWPRRRIPSPWAAKAWLNGPERADYLVMSNLDLPNITRTLRVLQEEADLEVVLHRAGLIDSVYVLRIEPQATEGSPLGLSPPRPMR